MFGKLKYDSNGTKYRKQEFDPGGNLLNDETYFGNLVLRNGRPFRILHDDGYVNLLENGLVGELNFHVKDHPSVDGQVLGNVRCVLSETPDRRPIIVQASGYYPFGMLFQSEQMQTSAGANANKYLYNGKEVQDMPGKWYDYGARFYDPQLGRFPSIDPIIEKFPYLTPFNYASNNPVTNIDLWGLQGANSNAVRANWMRNNPMGAIQEGFRQMFDAAASLFTVKVGVNIKSTTPLVEAKTGKFSGSVSKVKESKAEIIMDASNVFDYNGQNTKSVSDINPFSVETSTTTKIETEVNVTVNVEGVPVNFSNTQENTTSGESTNTTEISVGISSENGDANIYVNTSTTTNPDGTTSSVAAGAKANTNVVKSGNTTTNVGVYLEVQKEFDKRK